MTDLRQEAERLARDAWSVPSYLRVTKGEEWGATTLRLQSELVRAAMALALEAAAADALARSKETIDDEEELAWQKARAWLRALASTLQAEPAGQGGAE